MMEQKDAFGDVARFVQEYAVPEMLIKLRQGAGRLIRVKRIRRNLHPGPRAAAGSYVPRIKMALSKYPAVNPWMR